MNKGNNACHGKDANIGDHRDDGSDKSSEQQPVVVYTDGACRGNPGAGGWGVYFCGSESGRELYGGEADTTNNRMELRAAIEALRALRDGEKIILHTDSQYVRKGITEWMDKWKRNGWRTAARKPVKNADLWRELDAQNARHEITWKWVRGHAGDAGNERADALANKGVDSLYHSDAGSADRGRYS